MLKERICPKCGKRYTDYPAVSRVDDTTEICPACGRDEALEAWANYLNKTK